MSTLHPEVVPPSNPPRPRVTWLIGGGLLSLVGLAFLPTMFLTGIGIFMIIAGGSLIAGAFFSKRGLHLRTEHEVNRSHRRHLREEPVELESSRSRD